jgi:hypothetical protein
LEERGRFRDTVWLGELVASELNLTERVQAKIKLWSREVIRSRGTDLASVGSAQDLNYKYADLLKRKKRQDSLKAGFVEVGFDSSWKVREARETERRRTI